MGPAEELVRIAKKLDKMVARKSTEGALDLLKSLTGYTMTIQLLQTTRIGVAVNSMRKHCSDEEVVASAKILIKNWKRLLESSAPPKKEKDADGEKKEKEKRLDVPSPNEGVNPHAVKHPKSPAEKHREKHKERCGIQRDSADSRSSVSSSSSSPQKRPSGERRPSTGANPLPAPNSSRRSSSDSTGDRANSNKGKVETPRTPGSPPFSPSVCLLAPCYLTGDSVRDKCIEMLTAALRMDGEQDGVVRGTRPQRGRKWELKSTDMKYRNRVRSRISNLKDPKNPNLRRNVLCGAIAPALIARMTAEEMASDELKELRNAMTQEAIREHQMAKTGGTVTDLFQCGKCKKKNCTYNQVQTRSADEPMTTFVLCNECGNRWKVRDGLEELPCIHEFCSYIRGYHSYTYRYLSYIHGYHSCIRGYHSYTYRYLSYIHGYHSPITG
ncbi:hypothetical protein ASZ78_011090 [Callipepla squamata]|uniref:Transcription elongation factor A protein 3 n=1 Tax=Callipepla squamata TaxID=9009 RepID=A0A226MYT8_CALSU|nr:hypothetical protein ASZ78_011090 [Callipepla squamata]